MARSTRSSTLENRTSRLKLPTEKRFSVTIGKGLILLYRRGAQSSTWYAKIAKGNDKYLLHTLGQADDSQDANGVDILDYFQAQDKARQFTEEAKRDAGTIQKPMTVGDAAEHYLAWYKDHRKAYRETENTVAAHILPVFGNTLIADLTTLSVRKWHDKLATTAPRRSACSSRTAS
ncbi:MAG: N-terminal phage integrase SAM-like domain-containing protein [Candidatus Nitrotoga sp.]